jgi:hypothetical protein
MKMSNQMLTAIMISLQKSLMEQTDIVPLLKSFEMVLEGDELVVSNPPNTLKATPVEEK